MLAVGVVEARIFLGRSKFHAFVTHFAASIPIIGSSLIGTSDNGCSRQAWHFSPEAVQKWRFRANMSRRRLKRRHFPVAQQRTIAKRSQKGALMNPHVVSLLPLFGAAGVGAAIAAPVGPMSVLCMRRTLAQGWYSGFATGAGIATGDATFAAVAALSLASLTRVLLVYERPLQIAAGIFLLVLAWRALHADSAADDRVRIAPIGGAYGSALLLTLANPPTIISFFAIFTALAPNGGFNMQVAILTVIGVFVGSLAWWLLLTAGRPLARHALGARVRVWLDRASTAVLALLGAIEIGRNV